MNGTGRLDVDGTLVEVPLRTQQSVNLVVTSDLVVTDKLVVEPGSTIEFRNGAGLLFQEGGSADWRGTEADPIRLFGQGHVRFEHGSRPSTIRHGEINLQPDFFVPDDTRHGEYPLHWHHVMDGSRGTLVEDVTIRDSTNRGFVPHASHGITLRRCSTVNTVQSGFWWDEPPRDEDKGAGKSLVNNTHDALWEDCSAHRVVPPPGDPNRGRGLAGFAFGAGEGNVARRLTVSGVRGSDKNGGGFVWPSLDHSQPAIWITEDLTATDCTMGLWVWQNGPGVHNVVRYIGVLNDLDLSHGAYNNEYHYHDADVHTVEIHARGWGMTGGAVGTLIAKRNRIGRDGKMTPTVFTDMEIGRFLVRNADTNADLDELTTYEFNGTTLTWDDVAWENALVGTVVVIDGETRTWTEEGPK